MSCSTIQNKAFVPSFFPFLTNSPHGWRSRSFTISSVHLLPVFGCFQEEHQLFPVVSWWFLPVGLCRFQRSSGGSLWLHFPRELSKGSRNLTQSLLPTFRVSLDPVAWVRAENVSSNHQSTNHIKTPGVHLTDAHQVRSKLPALLCFKI